MELGPGAGALTQVLHERFPDMLAVDIDQRAVEVRHTPVVIPRISLSLSLPLVLVGTHL